MEFKYNEDVSRILDYLIFPSIFFFNREYKTTHDDSLTKVISDQYLDYAKNMEYKLSSSENIIKELFHQDIYSNHDYVNILMDAFPVYEYQDEHQYLKSLQDMDEANFKAKMIEALLRVDDESEKTKVSVNEKEAIQYINDLKIDSANKWNLLMMIQQPKEQLNKYIDLLVQYEKLFYDHYNQYQAQINEVGTRLKDQLSVDTAKEFNRLTYNSIDYDFDNGECGYLYISSFFPYTMRIRGEHPLRIVWGLEMERAFRMVHEINEDLLTQRVKVFKALGDKTRYETLKLLSQGVDSVKQIAKTLDVSSATISYHINEFLTSGIVHIRRGQQKKSTYQVDYDRLNMILEAFKEDLNF